MKRFSQTELLDTGCTGDFVRIGAYGEHIMFEANEWDSGFGGFHSVTLYLTTDEVKSLAARLARTVIEIESAEIPGALNA